MKNRYLLACLICNLSLFACSSPSFGTTYNINTFSGNDNAILSRPTPFIAGDTLNFQNDITATAPIGSLGVFALNVIGNGKTLDATGVSNAGFTVTSGGNYTFTSLNLNNFTGSNNGNAINNTGIISLTGSNFTGDTSTGSGGAIYNNGTASLTNTAFLNNISSGNGSTYGGGAIYNGS